jgi:hypothetical protein
MSTTDTPALRALLAEKGMPIPAQIATSEAVAAMGLRELPNGPVQNWGAKEDEAGMAPVSAAMRRARVEGMDQASKMISVESKLFSIYATGVVKAGKRETRVRVHAVVDFRNAPPPGQATTLAQLAQANALGGANAQPGSVSNTPQGTAGTGNGTGTPNPNDPNAALAAMLKPTPGGTVIHYKVE